jgi:hypothetical protein
MALWRRGASLDPHGNVEHNDVRRALSQIK